MRRRLVRLSVFATTFVVSAAAAVIFAFEDKKKPEARLAKCDEQSFAKFRRSLLSRKAPPLGLRPGNFFLYTSRFCDSLPPLAFNVRRMHGDERLFYVVFDPKVGGEGTIVRRHDKILFSEWGEAVLAADPHYRYLIFDSAIYRNKK
ncbi:MAG: hypothetical protein NZ534_00340 [Bacteroidia bacterium]|nr:hypothetical protein [Bacteroidia bacterium]